MALSLNDLRAMLGGFEDAGYVCTRVQKPRKNPIRVQWFVDGRRRRYQLWTFEITHGGGGPNVRAADEFRIQITKEPSSLKALDKEGAIDLLLGYSRDADVIVAYDRRWLEAAISNRQESGSRQSPSVQVKSKHIEAANPHFSPAHGCGRGSDCFRCVERGPGARRTVKYACAPGLAFALRKQPSPRPRSQPGEKCGLTRVESFTSQNGPCLARPTFSRCVLLTCPPISSTTNLSCEVRCQQTKLRR